MKTINTTAPGDSAKVGGDIINSNFAQLLMRTGRPIVRPLFDGDSKGGEMKVALQWTAAFEGLDIRFRGVNSELNIGGTTSGSSSNNLTSVSRMANIKSVLDTSSAAGEIVDYYLTIGTNDVTANITPQQTMANVRKLHETILRPQSCFRYLVLMSVDPRVTSSAGTSQIHSINRLYERYAALNPFDVVFIDTYSLLLDPAIGNTTGNPIPYTQTGTPSVLGSVMTDGLHCGNYGMFVKNRATATIKHLYSKKAARNLTQGLVNGDPMSLNANILGSGRTVALGGTIDSGFSNTGTGVITGTPPQDWTMKGSLNGTLGIAWSTSTVTVTTDGGLIPRGVWPTVRATFTGTGSGTASQLQLQTVGYPATGVYEGDIVTMGMLLNFNSFNNSLGFSTNTNNSSINNTSIGANAVYSSPLGEVINSPLNGPFLLEASKEVSVSQAGGFFAEVNVYIPPSAPVTGSIDFLSIFAERVGPIPAAAV